MFVIFGSFYLSGTGASSSNGFIWNLLPISHKEMFITYVLFILIEVGFYIVVTMKKEKYNKYYIISVITLIIIPFYHMSDANDFCMRASLPALFILMISVIKSINISNKGNTLILIILLIIGSVTPMFEIYRSLFNTHAKIKKDYISNEIVTFEHPKNGEYNELVNNQFYVHSYEDKVFFKYLARKTL